MSKNDEGLSVVSVLLLEGLLPEGGGEVEGAALGPGWQHAEEVAQVGPGLDAVELAAGEERDEDRVDARALVAAHEEPVFPAKDVATQMLLGHVVVEREATVVEESRQRDALVAGVTECLRDRRVVEDEGGLLVAPGEEGVDEGPRLLSTGLLALLARRRGDRAFDSIQPADQRERVLGPDRVRAERLVEVSPSVGPAPDLDHVAVFVEVIVDRVGIGDEMALVAGEQAIDGLAVVPVRVPVEDVPLGRDEHPEVGPAALCGAGIRVVEQGAELLATHPRRPGER